ncbi:MAG: hemerythrin domain-containing protein [Candidatus Thiodiazotropha sp.]
MQRHPALRKLSSEHHLGLVIARRAANAATGGDDGAQAEAWAEIQRRFVQELEPHFRTEETGLLPALAEAGEEALVARTLREHEAMRRMIAQADAARLSEFAELLRTHIRFEEQTLFETAQRRLDEAVLNGLDDAAGAVSD